MPNPLAIGGPLAAAVGGLSGVMRGGRQREWIDAAAYRFDQIGSPEARQVAQLIRDNPRAADRYVNKYFGGWENLETGLMERHHRGRAQEAVAKYQGMTPEERVGVDPRDVTRDLLDEYAEGSMSEFAVRAMASTFGAPEEFMQMLASSGADAETKAEAVRVGMTEGNWFGEGGAASKLKEPEDRRTSVSGDMVTTVTYDDQGVPTISRQIVPGSDLAKLVDRNRQGGPLLQRLVLHEELVRKGIARDSDEYADSYKKVNMDPLSDADLLEAQTMVRSTEYEGRRPGTAAELAQMMGGIAALLGGGGGGLPQEW